MNRIKNKIALPLALILLLSGCGGTGEEAALSQSEARPENSTGEIILTVSTYGNDAYLEEAALAFMERNENIKVEITVFEPEAETAIFLPDISESWGNLENTPESYVKSMNAALMSGRAPDIINMDVLPYYRYAESGLLADLKTYIQQDEDFKTEDYYENILTAMEYKGGLYMLPTDYSAYIAGVNKAYAGNGASGEAYSFNALAEAGAEEMSTGENEAGTYLYRSAAELFLQMYRELSSDFVDFEEGSVNFVSERFFDMANRVKDYMNRGLLPGFDEELSQDNRFYFYYDSMWSQQLLMPAFGYEEIYTRSAPLLDGDGKVYFTSGHAYAMSESSGHKEAAWEFLKFLLSEEMQATPGNFPIRKATLKDAFSEQLMQMFNMSIEDGFPINGDPEEIVADYIASIEKWSGEIAAYQFRDFTLEGIVMNEAAKFLKGEKSLEDTAAEIQNRAEIYLNEEA